VTIANDSMTKNIITDIAYNEFGQMTDVYRGNGTITTYAYDVRGRLGSLLTTSNANGTLRRVQDVKYAFKVDNSIASVENTPDVDVQGAADSTVRYEYRYDGLNRLVSAFGNYQRTSQAPGGDVTRKFSLGYGYAANGNLTTKRVYDGETGALDDLWPKCRMHCAYADLGDGDEDYKSRYASFRCLILMTRTVTCLSLI
jgi:YD repeat-containing protein